MCAIHGKGLVYVCHSWVQQMVWCEWCRPVGAGASQASRRLHRAAAHFWCWAAEPILVDCQVNDQHASVQLATVNGFGVVRIRDSKGLRAEAAADPADPTATLTHAPRCFAQFTSLHTTRNIVRHLYVHVEERTWYRMKLSTENCGKGNLEQQQRWAKKKEPSRQLHGTIPSISSRTPGPRWQRRGTAPTPRSAAKG